MICPTCGKEIEDGALVCEYCNQEFTYEEEAVEDAAKVEVVEDDAVVANQPSKVLAIIALVCGILSLAGNIIGLGILSPVFAIASIVLAVVYMKKGGVDGKKMAKIGMILGIVGLVLFVIVFVVSLVVGIGLVIFATATGALEDILWEVFGIRM
ncbi:MAG: hypothetical protein IJ437_05850 [Clostridia bacterium]|nr:hypothetical protein [Clostridia bacterium]